MQDQQTYAAQFAAAGCDLAASRNALPYHLQADRAVWRSARDLVTRCERKAVMLAACRNAQRGA
jgi:hypothetical protein